MRVLQTLFAAGLAACAIALAPTASAESLSPGNARGKCLTIERSGVVISRCDGSAAQDFRLSRNGRLESNYGCLAAGREGSALTLERCGRDNRQRWDLSGGLLRNGNGLCADVEGGRSNDGTRVLAYRCHGNSNQRWSLVDGRYDGGGRDDDRGGRYGDGVMLSPGHVRKCMDASNRSGNPLVIHDCHGRDNQRFSFNERGRTEIRVNGGCVTAPRERRKPYYVASCSNSRAQRFEFQRNGAIVDGNGECIDVLSGETRNGTLVVPYTCSQTPSQTWSSRRR